MGIDRRRFVVTTGVALGSAAALPLGAAQVPAVEAIPTVFHGHPDGTRTLVRFVIRNSDAPAGRMRVYDDRTNALLGTAGVLPTSERRLIGELWLPLQRPLRIRTEFEYPGTRQPLRDRFTLDPTPRWTLHWLLLADPAAVEARLARIDPLWRGVAGAALTHEGVQLDPVRIADPLTDAAAARIAWPAWESSRATGVPLAPLGTALRGFAALPGVMQASGLSGTAGMIDEPWTLLDAVPPSLPALQRLVEERLVARDTPQRRGIVVVPVADRPPVLNALLEEWGQRFAAPVITVGVAPPGLRARSVSIPRPPLPEGTQGLAERAAARAPSLIAEEHDAFLTLARRVGAGGDPFTTIARALRYPIPGVMAFNTTPWGRTDAMRLADGTTLVATNVPGLGYAFLPSDSGAVWPSPVPVGAMATIASATWQLRVDGTGAMASLIHRPSGTELAGPRGLGAVHGARADALFLSRAPGLGEQLTVRCTAGGLTWTTMITLHEGVDTVDVTTDAGPWDATWTFDPAVDGARTRWAEPLGVGAAEGPFAPVATRDWFSADGERGSLMVATPGGGILSRDEAGVLHCRCPAGPMRLRIAFARPALPEDPWRVGSLGTPLRAVAAPGTGLSTLPSFGQLLEVRDPGVRLLALRPAADGVGAIAYLHDLMGFERPAPIRGGLLAITTAFGCDLLERDRAQLAVVDGTVMVTVPAGGVAAVRILSADGPEG